MKNKYKFKEGQKIRCVDGNVDRFHANQLEAGKIYTFQRYAFVDACYLIDCPIGGIDSLLYDPKRFIPVSIPKKLKVKKILSF